MNKLKKIIIGFWTTLALLVPIAVFAVQITVPSAPGNGYMLISTTTGVYIATTTSGINLGWINATSSIASIFPYASTTVISSSGGAFFNTSAGLSSFQPVMIGTSTIPQLTTGVMSTLWVQRKENITNNTFYPVVTIGENSNSGSVISGGGPCYGYYEGSTGTGRYLAEDCVMYDNPVNFIRGARISLITDANGNFLPYMRAEGTGNISFGASTTNMVGSLVARAVFLNILNSAQDIIHADQGTGLATTTVFAVKSTGFTGIASSSPWATLSVTNTSASPSFVVEDSASPDTTPFIIDANGLLGNGTTTPVARENITTTASTTNVLLESTTAAVGGCMILKDVGTGGGYTQVYAVGGVLFSKVATSLSICN